MTELQKSFNIPSRQEVEQFIMDAADGQNGAITEFFEKYGTEAINARTSGSNRTALMLAIRWQRAETIALLLAKGADLDISGLDRLEIPRPGSKIALMLEQERERRDKLAAAAELEILAKGLSYSLPARKPLKLDTKNN